MPTLSSSTALEVVILTPFDASSDNNIDIVTTLSFQFKILLSTEHFCQIYFQSFI